MKANHANAIYESSDEDSDELVDSDADVDWEEDGLVRFLFFLLNHNVNSEDSVI